MEKNRTYLNARSDRWSFLREVHAPVPVHVTHGHVRGRVADWVVAEYESSLAGRRQPQGGYARSAKKEVRLLPDPVPMVTT
jgi:hypothetical protein